MNFIVISPDYPTNFRQFSIELAKKGIKVLGIGEGEYDSFPPELKEAFTEYFKVGNLEDTDEVLRAVAFLFYKHGPIDRVESHNEHWLPLDDAIRTQFNIPGMDHSGFGRTRKKSRMKKQFLKAGAPVVDGKVIDQTRQIKNAAKKFGLPIIAKPNIGVGATDTFKLHTEEDVAEFEEKFESFGVEYFFEPFVEGDIYTYDGLIDSEGNIVFETGMKYNVTPLVILTKEADVSYTVTKTLDPKLVEYGRNIVATIGMKERFFHIEFFKKSDGSYITIEYNNRPPGAFAVDMYNYAYSRNLYEDYANVVLGNPIPESIDNESACIACTRREDIEYLYPESELYDKYSQVVIAKLENPEGFRDLQGNFTYILKGNEQEVMDAYKILYSRK